MGAACCCNNDRPSLKEVYKLNKIDSQNNTPVAIFCNTTLNQSYRKQIEDLSPKRWNNLIVKKNKSKHLTLIGSNSESLPLRRSTSEMK
jgi:hypothetical protein